MSITHKIIKFTEQKNEWMKPQISNSNYIEAAIRAGVDDIEADRIIDGETVMNRLRKRLANS